MSEGPGAGEEPTSDGTVVFVAAFPIAAHPRAGEGKQEVAFETCELKSGEHAAMAFTSTKKLAEALGQWQPWIALQLGLVRQVVGASGLSQVAVDPVLPAGARRWSEADILRLKAGPAR
jgi:hypothetical protein